MSGPNLDGESRNWSAFGFDPVASVAITDATLGTKITLPAPGIYHFISTVALVFRRGLDAAAAAISDVTAQGTYLPAEVYLYDVVAVAGALVFDARAVTVAATGRLRIYRSKQA